MKRPALLAFAAAIAALAQQEQPFHIQLLAKDFTFTEGPAWSKDGFLVFSDTPSDRIIRWYPGREVEAMREHAGGPRGNAFDSQGRLYTCETRTRRVTRTDRAGKTDVVAADWEGKRFNAPSHIAISKTDHVYFTDPAFGSEQDKRELDFYGIYHLPPRGPLKLVAKSATRVNGIALAPNGRTLYVGDADARTIRAYELDKNGDATANRVLIAATPGIPGGLATDDKGNLYVTAGKAVISYTPEGKERYVLNMHGAPADCAFAEGDQKTLVVTSRGEVFRAREDK